MYSRTVTIINPTGLHARPASEFVKTAGQFACDIKLKKAGDENLINAKSIVFLLSMGLHKGTEIEIIADGNDEKEAVDTLLSLIESGFGE